MNSNSNTNNIHPIPFNKLQSGQAVCLERFNVNDLLYGKIVVYQNNLSYFVFYPNGGTSKPLFLSLTDYNLLWRCWSRQPSEQARLSASWNNDNKLH